MVFALRMGHPLNDEASLDRDELQERESFILEWVDLEAEHGKIVSTDIGVDKHDENVGLTVKGHAIRGGGSLLIQTLPPGCLLDGEVI